MMKRDSETRKKVGDVLCDVGKDEFLAKKIAEIKISPRISKLIEETRLTPEEAEDERTRYILGLDRR